MRKLLLSLFILFSFVASAQKIQYVNTYGYEYNRFVADSLLGLPKDTFTVPASLQNIPFIANKSGSIYNWNIITHVWDLFSSYTDADARAAISLTTIGTSGAATYNSSTGVFNIPIYNSLDTIKAKNDSIFYQVGGNEYYAAEQRNQKVPIYYTKDRPYTAAFNNPVDTSLVVTADTIDFHSTTLKALGMVLQKETVADTLYHLYERWEISADITLTGFYANGNEGCFIGIRNSNTVSDLWGFNIKAHGGSTSIILPTFTSAAANAATYPTTGLSFTNGDILRIQVRRERDRFILNIFNATSRLSLNWEVLIGYDQIAILAGPTLINAFLIMPRQGNFKISNVTINSYDGASDVIFLGNSITAGVGGTTYHKGFSKLWREYNKKLVVAVNAGASSTTADIIEMLPQVIKVRPSNVVLLIGVNDLTAGITQSQTIANVGTIVDSLEAHGINVKILTYTPVDSRDMRPYNTDLVAAFPGQVINVFNRLADAGTFTFNDLYSADGLHPNNIGHYEIFDILRDSMVIDADRNFIATHWGDIIGSPSDQPDLQTYIAQKVDFTIHTAGLALKQNLLVNSAGLAAALTNETGTNLAVFSTAPTIVGLNLAAGTTTVEPLNIASGTLKTTPASGDIEFDGTNYFGTTSTTRYIFAKTLTATAVLDFASTVAGAISDLTITVTGAADGDVVIIGVPNGSVTATATYTAWVSAANTVTVRFSPKATEDPASGTFRASVIKY